MAGLAVFSLKDPSLLAFCGRALDHNLALSQGGRFGHPWGLTNEKGARQRLRESSPDGTTPSEPLPWPSYPFFPGSATPPPSCSASTATSRPRPNRPAAAARPPANTPTGFNRPLPRPSKQALTATCSANAETSASRSRISNANCIRNSGDVTSACSWVETNSGRRALLCTPGD